jgi:hypothetical protein
MPAAQQREARAIGHGRHQPEHGVGASARRLVEQQLDFRIAAGSA